MKDGNEGHGMNKKYEKFKLAVGTTFAFFILVAVMGIAFVQNRYADENILEDELLEIQGDEKFHYVETGITYWQYKDTEGEPSIDSNGKRWNEAGYLTEDWKEAKGSFGIILLKRRLCQYIILEQNLRWTMPERYFSFQEKYSLMIL